MKRGYVVYCILCDWEVEVPLGPETYSLVRYVRSSHLLDKHRDASGHDICYTTSPAFYDAEIRA